MECEWLLNCLCMRNARLLSAVSAAKIEVGVSKGWSYPPCHSFDSPISVSLTPPGVRYLAWLSKGFELIIILIELPHHVLCNVYQAENHQL